jgi:broad specificity phosphatase PhoE
MKNLSLKIFIVLFFAGSLVGIDAKCVAQKKATTIILVRHAEKATTGGDNPELSAEGKKRADRLQASFPNVTPDAFYSTAYIRTQQTLAPWSKQASKEIITYDASKQPEFADSLLKQMGKTIVVVGHSNTVPVLVNLLLNQEKFQNLADNEYDKLFVVTINKNKRKVKVLTF